MKTCGQIFIAIFLMAFINEICAQTPTSITFKVYGNGYVGRISFDSINDFKQIPLDGYLEFTFSPGESREFYFNTGATVGSAGNHISSYFNIKFNNSGKIINVIPSTAAEIGEDSLSIKLNTKKVIIKPRRYDRYWRTTFDYDTTAPYTYYNQKRKIKLITNITYTIRVAEDASIDTCFADNCMNIKYYNVFNFNVDSNGYIELISPSMSAKAKGNKVKFNYEKIYIDPDSISNGSPLTFRDGNSDTKISKGTWVKFVYLTANFFVDDNGNHYYIVPH